MDTLRTRLRCRVEKMPDRCFLQETAERAVDRQFGLERRRALPADNAGALLALGGLLHYLHDTQKTDLSYIRELDYYREGRFMELDLTARRNLELTETLRNKEKKGTLLWVLDRTYVYLLAGSSAPGWSGPFWTWRLSAAAAARWRPWRAALWTGRS